MEEGSRLDSSRGSRITGRQATMQKGNMDLELAIRGLWVIQVIFSISLSWKMITGIKTSTSLKD